MKIAAMTFRLHAPWVHSLKEKRMIVKSLIAKLQNRYHVSVAEIDAWREKKASEEANARYNEMLYYDLTDDPVDV